MAQKLESTNLSSSLSSFKKLYSIYGIGKKFLRDAYFFSGVNVKTFPKKLKKRQKGMIEEQLKLRHSKLGAELAALTKRNITYYYQIKSCKGMRHYRGYPIRGQRTQTNAKTKRRLKNKN